jgi:predicted nucleotidyltransferase
VDLTHPISAVVPSLDGEVLEVLARTTRSLSGREVQRLAGVGSPNGVRAVLNRLASQGVVVADPRANAVFYTLNREHLAAPAVTVLVTLRTRLVERLRESFRSWNPEPVHASMFGSAARGDGGVDSDIDVLLVRPGRANADRWEAQVGTLAERVHMWTGNHCQVYELTRRELAEHVRAKEPIVDSWRRDARTLHGPDIRVLLGRPA